MDIVRLEEHGLADIQLDVVQEELNEEANVAGELGVQAHNKVSKLLAVVRWAGTARKRMAVDRWAAIASKRRALGLGRRDELLGGRGKSVLVCVHDLGEDGLKSFLVGLDIVR